VKSTGNDIVALKSPQDYHIPGTDFDPGKYCYFVVYQPATGVTDTTLSQIVVKENHISTLPKNLYLIYKMFGMS